MTTPCSKVDQRPYGVRGTWRCRKVSPPRSHSLPGVHAPSKTLSRCVTKSRARGRTLDSFGLISVNVPRSRAQNSLVRKAYAVGLR